MIDLILLGILVLGILIGLKRGFILQLLHLIGFIVAFIVAVSFYGSLASRLTMWIPYPDLPEGATWAIFLDSLPLETAFYNGIAFAILFFGTKIVLQIIASMLDFVADLPVLNTINSLLGGILGFLEMYLLLFVFLYIAALVPAELVQNWIEHSGVATFIIEKTPYVSNQLKSLWF